MFKFNLFTIAASATVVFGVTQAPAQILRQPPAPLQNAMTESQARSACRAELSGGRRESRKAIAKKTQICIQNKMNGTNR
jgi:hypothetical protein